MIHMSALARKFVNLRCIVHECYPTLSVSLLVDDDFPYDPARGYAYCEQRKRDFTIGVSPDIMQLDLANIDALLMHEFGHAVLLLKGREKHTERDADAEAEDLFGKNISYDVNDVQTTAPGERPRPEHLPNKACES